MSVLNTETGSKRHMCALGSSPSATWAQGGVPNLQAAAQAPCVPTWFFFDSNKSFLKFINDDNNNNNF